MTTVNITASDGRYSIYAHGHSGYAECGSDIVCAAISGALGLAVQTVYNLERDGILSDVTCNAGDGMQKLEFSGGGVARALFASICQIIGQVAAQFPENVAIREGL